uniref:Agglucetin subunit alpha-1 n=1 Tax=Deinagkistrodon acutus TaxID=36307 RepID=UPI00025C06D6|nr:Chain A, Agglucetin subunit alpha-1 [Deinagkistrodon acutus]
DVDCLPGWSAYDQSCYRVFKLLKTWDDAEKFCTERPKGGHLVSIESAGERDFVAQLVSENKQTDNVWLGLKIQSKGQQCSTEWTDGSSVSYENFSEYQSKKCFVLEKNTGFRTWLNLNCGSEYSFVCKSPP